MMIAEIPNVFFNTRVRDESIEGPNPYRWETTSSEELWGTGKHVVFSLPGAFTPTCSTYQLPGFEKACEDGTFKQLGIDSVSVISVNDAFVMNAWAKQQDIKHVKAIPDGSGRFTRMMGMLVDKDNLGFGMRSWRYAMIINNGIVEALFEEPGREDNHPMDPYGETSPETIIDFLNENAYI